MLGTLKNASAAGNKIEQAGYASVQAELAIRKAAHVHTMQSWPVLEFVYSLRFSLCDLWVKGTQNLLGMRIAP